MKTCKKLLAAILMIFPAWCGLQAQSLYKISPPAKQNFECYIIVSSINSRQDVKNLQEIIGKKAGVNSFMANRYPVRFFLLRSSRKIDRTEFAQWLPAGGNYQVKFFGDGNEAREEAILIYNTNKIR